ncbi:MAG: glycosyltransferase [Ferruginibacter sp.]
MPLMLMQGIDVYITNNLKQEDFEKGCDIFIYNRTIPDEVIPVVSELKERYGFRICVDIDDHWKLDPHHILYDHFQETEFAKQQIEHIMNADLVTVTHERLAAAVMEYNKNVHILPNAIPNQGQFDIERTKSEVTRLFWQGSVTHKADIEILDRPINALAPIFPKIKMIMAGWMDGEPDWHSMVHSYTAGFKHCYKIIPGKHVAEYYSNYAEADICLIPLVNSPFNRMKSNLKVLEAANLGLPVICSHVHPYLDLPVIYAKNTTEWVVAINRLVASKKRQKEAGQELKEFVDKHYNFEKINRERKQLFEHQMSLA